METKNFNNNVNGNINSTSVYNQETIQNTPQNIDWEGTPWMERKPSHPERIITIGTSCSGIGAPEQALQQLGLKTKIMFAGDIDSNVKKSYFANYPITEEQWHDDLRTFDASPYKDKISVLICGVCCQPFSKASKNPKGTEDEERGNLANNMRDVIRACQPKVWIMENVDNMLSCGKGKHWKKIKRWFDETGYDIHYQVLNALDYGLPQNRNRLFVIGFKEPNPDFKFPAPVELNKCVRDYLIDTTPAFRRLYPREALNLQGFSEDFKMEVPDYAIYHQAGNSIAVPVLKAIFSQIDLTKYGFDPEELGMEVEEPVRSGYVEDNKPVVEDMKEMEISKSTPMTITDLKSEMETLKSEIEERQSKLDKLVSEFENRKNEVVNNWKQHMKLVMEDTKVMIEMGIDPSTLSFDEMELSCDTIHVSDNTVIAEENDYDTMHETNIEGDNDEKTMMYSPILNDIKDEMDDDDEYPFLSPFYKLWKLKINRTDKPKKKEKTSTDYNPITGIGMVAHHMIPFYKLYKDGPVRALLKIGNKKYKTDYPDPEEGRVISADGYMQTLTFTHSDCNIWIGPKYDENGNRITPITPVIDKAA